MIAIGIDTHKSSLAASAVDPLGIELASTTVANAPAGHRALLCWLAGLPGERRVGIEGSGGLGLALTRRLIAAGETVVDVPPTLTARERRHQPRPAKSDPIDARAIARVTLRESRLAQPGGAQASEDIALVVRARDELVVARTRQANRLHADLVVLAPGYESQIGNLVAERNLGRTARLLGRQRGVRAELARERLRELRELDRRIKRLSERLPGLVAALGSSLTAIPGVGLVLAAKLLAETRDVRRFHSEAAFAATAGTAPLDASSGRTKRHRLNRGGDRQLNRALHQVALVQVRWHAPARAYVERRRAAGRSWLEAIRCLKRYIARTVYRTMLADALRSGH
ncbi:MAG: IS110 family transposase [Candidatus Limnocylindrales bacterium]